MEQKNEVAVKPQNEVAIPQDAAAWGTGGISANDIIIPRIFLMQPMSEKVTGDEAKFGEFRESLANAKMGDFDNGFEIIPFHLEKVWVEFDTTKGDDFKNKEFKAFVPITPENENLPYKDEENKISRDRCMNFYVLIPDELEIGGAIPYILTARRSSLTAGKQLSTQMYVKNVSAGKSPASVICKVSSKKETNDEGTFAVMNIVPSRATPDKFVAEAFKWLQLIKAGRAKVDTTGMNEEFGVGTAAPPPQAKGPAQF